MGVTVNKKFLVLPALVAGCMIQQSAQGWSPPLGILRRMGYRTRAEIEQERYALKALRGDFEDVRKASEQVTGEGIDKAMTAVQI